MIQKTRGIVLHTTKYNDTSLIVDIYTEECGRVPFLVSIPKTKRARVKIQLFQALTLVEIDFDQRANANLQRIKDVRCFFPFSSLPYEPVKTAIALFLSEFLSRALHSEIVNAPLFAYLVNSIEWFDTCTEHYTNFHLVFLMRLTRFLGFYPNAEDYRKGDYFDLINSCFTSVKPLHGAAVEPEDAEKIGMLLRLNYDTMRHLIINGAQRMRCLEVINDYYRLHIPDFPTLKSISILHDLFR
jgi:DNA repair protein RecO (recombination protein O)